MLKIYITDLAAYNNGFLIGEWISLPMDQDDLSSKIKTILREGEAACDSDENEHEEYFITDYEFENNYQFAEVGEYSNPYNLNSACEELSEYDEEDLKRISYLTDNVGYNLEAAMEKYEEVNIYEDMTLTEVVEQYIEETVDFTNIPDIIAHNINYDSIKVDFEISGEYETIGNDVYHFINC